MTDWLNLVASSLGVDAGDISVVTSREDRAIFRVESAARPLVAKVSARADAFREEVAAMDRLRALDLPVSDVVVLEPGPPALFAATWAEGEPVSAASSPETLAEVGRILRRIHGERADPPYSAHPSIHAWIEHWFQLVVAWWASTDGVTAEHVREANAWMSEVRPVLATLSGSLMLFDGRPEHWLVDDAGALHLIDVADLQAGHFAMDLAVLELGAPGILEGVLIGYGPSESERQAIDALVPFFVWLRAVAGAEWQGSVGGDQEAVVNLLALARNILDARTNGDD